VNDTEENDAFQIDHVRRTQESSETTKTTLSKEKQIHSQETTRKEDSNVNKHFQTNEANDAN
jgi:hypothetical protein